MVTGPELTRARGRARAARGPRPPDGKARATSANVPNWLGQVWGGGSRWTAALAYYPDGGGCTAVIDGTVYRSAAEAIAAVDAAIEAGAPE